jgi:hypothetical protein
MSIHKKLLDVRGGKLMPPMQVLKEVYTPPSQAGIAKTNASKYYIADDAAGE